jgi:hypothetical protein
VRTNQCQVQKITIFKRARTQNKSNLLRNEVIHFLAESFAESQFCLSS